jgi:hypothetical protein
MEKTNQNPQLHKMLLNGFAQYFGQRILNPYSLLTYTNTGVIKEINAVQLNIRDNDFIELKSLSKLLMKMLIKYRTEIVVMKL